MALLLQQGRYGNGRISLRLQGEDGVPYCNVTTNVPSLTPNHGCVFLDNHIVPDVNGVAIIPDVLDFLEKAQVLRRTGVSQEYHQSFNTFFEAELLDLDLPTIDLDL